MDSLPEEIEHLILDYLPTPEAIAVGTYRGLLRDMKKCTWERIAYLGHTDFYYLIAAAFENHNQALYEAAKYGHANIARLCLELGASNFGSATYVAGCRKHYNIV